jgi:hypothetical protein
VQIIFKYNPAGIYGFIEDSNGDIDKELDLDKLYLSEIDWLTFILHPERFP